MNPQQQARLSKVLDKVASEGSESLDASSAEMGFPVGIEGVAQITRRAGDLKYLSTLCLRGAKIGSKGARLLYDAREHWPQLATLDLEANALDADGARLIAVAAEAWHLRHLNLSENDFGPDGVRHLSDHAAHLSELQELRLAANEVDMPAALSLKRLAPHLGSLLFLDLSGCLFQEGHTPTELIQTVVRVAAQWSSLEKLHLEYNDLGPALADALVTDGRVWRGLRELRLGRNRLGEEGAADLAFRGDAWPALETLDLTMSLLGTEGCNEINNRLGQWPRLTRLGLAENGIGPRGVQDTTGWGSVSDLDLSWNDLRDSGTLALLFKIDEWTALSKLSLRSNWISARGARILFEAVGEWGRITHLDTRENPFGDSGAEAFAACAPQLGRLQSLRMDRCHLGPRGAKSVALASQHLRSMSSLSLSGNWLTDDGVYWLLAASCREPWRSGLRNICLTDTGTTLPAHVLSGDASAFVAHGEMLLRSGQLPILAVEALPVGTAESVGPPTGPHDAVPYSNVFADTIVYGPLRIALERAVHVDSRPPLRVALGVRNTDRLFVRLVRARGTAVRVRDLLDDLWPGDDSRSERSLQNEVSKLREWLRETGLDRYARVPDAERGLPHYRLELVAEAQGEDVERTLRG